MRFTSGTASLVPRPLEHHELPAAERLLDHELGGRIQHRLGEAVDVLALPSLALRADDALAGLATYAPSPSSWEVAVLLVDAAHRRRGLAGALLDALAERAVAAQATELWLVTTNDNLAALALYQRRGYHLAELHAGAVTRARAAKPAIPELGAHGIPLRDELVLCRPLP